MMQDEEVRQADEVLNIFVARGILHVIWEQGRLAYFYDCAREVLTENGYEVITKREALAFWPLYHGGASTYEVQPSSAAQCRCTTAGSVVTLLTAVCQLSCS